MLANGPDGLGNITNVDSVELEILGPEELHLVAKMLVDGGSDDAGGNTGDISRAVDNGGTQNDKGKANGSQSLFSLVLVHSLGGPGLDLAIFLGWLGTRVVHLGGRHFDELLDTVGLRGVSDLVGKIQDLFVVDLGGLAVLGLCRQINHIVKVISFGKAAFAAGSRESILD